LLKLAAAELTACLIILVLVFSMASLAV